MRNTSKPDRISIARLPARRRAPLLQRSRDEAVGARRVTAEGADMKLPITSTLVTKLLTSSDRGAMGYILLWLLGVPASLLFVIFLLRGCT